MKPIKSAITIIALVATAFSLWTWPARRVSRWKWNPCVKDSVEQPLQATYKLWIYEWLTFGTEGLPEIQSRLRG